MAPEKCTGPDCSRLVQARGLCRTHYQQQRRGGPLRPIAEPQDYSAQVVVRMPADLKERAEAAAKAEGIEPAEWWRRVAEWALEQ